jgi:hypothetical protein
MIELLGPPKAGKSFLALDVAFKVARGEQFLGRPCKASKVLYLQLDNSEKVTRDRGVQLRLAGYDTKAPNLVMVHPDDTVRPLNIMMAHGKNYLRNCVLASNPSLIVIDTLRELHSDDENDSTAMKQVMDSIEEVSTNRSLLLVHHTNKIAPEVTHPDPIQSSRGSSYITGKVDAYWLLYHNTLSLTSRWDEPLEYPCKQNASGMFDFPDTLPIHEIRQIVIDLKSANPHLGKAELAKIALNIHKISRATFHRIYHAL